MFSFSYKKKKCCMICGKDIERDMVTIYPARHYHYLCYYDYEKQRIKPSR